ncbi:MAG: permease prefix domain 1-containing protein [Peptococcaceae bacterium]|nr:permease prefix domain 1-containing protein [Peptococcaceae bacterium]
MSELENHVNHLFKSYANSQKNNDLKAEILSNLEAKKLDLLKSGMDEPTAIQQAKDTLTSVDCLMDENRHVFAAKYRLAILQILLLYVLVAWIVSIPLTVIGFWKAHDLIFACVIAAGTGYLIANLVIHLVWPRFAGKSPHKTTRPEQISIVNLDRVLTIRRWAWGVWSIFIILSTILVTAVMFGSNLWYSRPIVIDGPYNLAIILASYLEPFFTIVIPLVIHKIPSLVLKYEAEAGDSLAE